MWLFKKIYIFWNGTVARSRSIILLGNPKKTKLLKCSLILIVLSWVPLVTGEGPGYHSPDNTRQEDMIDFTVYLNKYYSCLWWLFWNELSQLAKSFKQYILTFKNIQTMNKKMDLIWESSCSFMVHHTKFVYSNYKPLTIHSVNLFYFKVDVNWRETLYVLCIFLKNTYFVYIYLFQGSSLWQLYNHVG